MAITPKAGGKMATDVSADQVGIQNYRLKRNWRRYIDRERRREGLDYFQLRTPDLKHVQAINAGSPIILMLEAFRSDGKRAIICATQTTIYRYTNAEMNLLYCPGYTNADSYFTPYGNPWTVIGSGFSTQGHRWEAVQVQDDIVFNNGVDLPVAYNLGDLQVFPIYELREQGVISVGTIASYFGMLMCFNILQIKDGLNPATGNSFSVDLTYPSQQPGQLGFAGAYVSWYPGQAPCLATQAVGSTTVTIAGNLSLFHFTLAMVGSIIVFNNGFRAQITAYVSSTQVTVSAAPVAQPILGPELFVSRGNTFPTLLPVSDGTYYCKGYPSGLISFYNGTSYQTAQSNTQFTVATGTGWPLTITGDITSVKRVTGTGGGNISMPFRISSADNTSKTLTSGIPVFSADMVGLKIIFAGERVRTITSYISPTQVVLDSDWPIFGASQGYPVLCVIENKRAYSTLGSNLNLIPPGATYSNAGTYTISGVTPKSTYVWTKGRIDLTCTSGSSTAVSGQNSVAIGTTIVLTGTPGFAITATLSLVDTVDRIQYRALWSALEGARRFAPSFPCWINNGSRMLTLDYPVKSLKSGQSVTVLGAGVAGGNLTANIICILGRQLLLDQAAQTAVGEDPKTGYGLGLVQAADMTGSTVGYQDLQNDGTKVVRALELNGNLVVYRERGYQLGSYTGNNSNPFSFAEEVITNERSVFYPWSLIAITGTNYFGQGIGFHLYAGANGFFRYDMISQIPIEFALCQENQQTFLQSAAAATASGTVAYQDLVFSAENELTKEIFFCFPPSPTGVDAAFCLDYVQNTMSLMDYQLTAGASVWNPYNQERLFVCGNAAGQVMTYGKANIAHSEWNGATEYYMRLGNQYTSDQYSGLGNFGNSLNQKTCNMHLLELSSFTPDTKITVSIYGSEAPNSGQQSNEVLLASQVFTNPSEANAFPMYYCATYFADRIQVTGSGPCEITTRSWNIATLKTAGSTKTTY